VNRLRQSWPGLRSFSLVFVAGALAALGHAPLYLWPLTLLGLAFVTRKVVQVPQGAGWIGLAGGMGYGAVALSWIVEPFLVWPEVYGWMAPFALFFMALGLGLFWALAALAARRLPFAAPAYGFALTLTFVEFLRGHILTGFPWALPGHVWISTPVAQLGAWVGPTGLTLAILLMAAALAQTRKLPAFCATAALAAAWALGLWTLSQPLSADRAATVRLVQPNAEQALKWAPDQARQFFDRLLLATAADPQPDLVIWPETALPYMLERHAELAPMISSAAKGAQVALGAQREDGSRFWNSLTVVKPDGTIGARYDKHHLVPFGEYVPLGDLTNDLFAIGAFASSLGAGYTAGEGPKLIDFGPELGRALPLICYEAVFPQDVNAAPERADWLLHITNDAWFGVISGPFQHADQARMRAIEQGLPLVRVANTGVTAVYDARGQIRASLPFGTQGYLDAALPSALPPTPFSRFGETPALVLLGGLALLLIRRRRAKLS
jgi:apolipoprotein N-acyltransferase